MVEKGRGIGKHLNMGKSFVHSNEEICSLNTSSMEKSDVPLFSSVPTLIATLDGKESLHVYCSGARNVIFGIFVTSVENWNKFVHRCFS